MKTEHQPLIKKEMITAAVISASISVCFVFAIFAGSPQISLWGAGGAAIDFLPQTFMLSLMSALVPALLLRKKLARKQFYAVAGRTWYFPQQPVLRSFLIALVATAVGSLAATTALFLISGDTIAFAVLLITKTAYGAIIAAFVARLSVKITIAHAWNEASASPKVPHPSAE